MDTIRGLLQQVVRGFYDVRSVIVMDAVLFHHVLSDKDLMQLMGVPAKDLRAVCARLKEDHLLKEVSHKDDATRDHRVFSQTYYYVHFTEAVDAIKWKMYSIENRLKTEMDAQHNPHDYVCDVCKRRYDTIAAAALFDPASGQFICEVCENPLREDDGPSPEEQSAQDRMGELMRQLQPLISTLRQIDDLTIPENTFQSEMQQAVPVPEPEPEQAPRVPRDDDGLPTAAASKLPQPAPASFQVHITSEAERRDQESALREDKKRLAEENALPEWHAQSTVGAGGEFGSTKLEPLGKAGAAAVKDEPGAAPTAAAGTAADDDAMEAYYKKLQEQQNTGQDDDDEDDDEDEFEDVDV